MQWSFVSGCLTRGFVELELQHKAHEVPAIREEKFKFKLHPGQNKEQERMGKETHPRTSGNL